VISYRSNDSVRTESALIGVTLTLAAIIPAALLFQSNFRDDIGREIEAFIEGRFRAFGALVKEP
jgi:hypothetical protein